MKHMLYSQHVQLFHWPVTSRPGMNWTDVNILDFLLEICALLKGSSCFKDLSSYADMCDFRGDSSIMLTYILIDYLNMCYHTMIG